MGFAEAMHALMAERGISGRKLARLVHCDQALICRYRNARQNPSARMARLIDAALGADGSLVALAGPSRRAVLAGGLAAVAGPPLAGALGPAGAERLAWAARHPRRIDGETVRSLTEMLAVQRRAEDSLGSAALVRPVKAQLAAVEDLVTEARGPLRPAVLDLAQQWAQFAAWLHMSVRDIPAARALWRQTLELATEAGDATMTATVLRELAYMAWIADKPGPAIGLTSAAQRDPRAAPNERAQAAALEARAHALAGDADTAERKLGEAADLAERGRLARWSYWATPQYFDCERGAALGYLAHIDRYRVQAIEALTAGHQSLGPDMRDSEWGAAYLTYRAAAHARGGDVAEACADALHVVPIWRQTSSASLRGLLAQLHADLQARWPGDARVAELADALR